MAFSPPRGTINLKQNIGQQINDLEACQKKEKPRQEN